MRRVAPTFARAPVRAPSPEKGTGGSRAFARRQKRARALQQRRMAEVARRPAGRVRGLLSKVPTAAWVCAAIALLNGLAWSVIVPPFQGRDEIDHFAYVQVLVEKGKLPPKPLGGSAYPPQEAQVLFGLHYWEDRFTPYAPSISSAAEQRELIGDVERSAPGENPGLAGATAGEPPLFYAVQAIPYELGSGNVLVQLQLMRLLDVAMGAATALLIFLFLRLVVPDVPWAATVAAACVALQPMFGFMTGSLNPDALIYLLSATVFLCLAVGFRKRLSARLAVLLGLAIAAGLLTYLSFIGVALGALAALAILAIRDLRADGRRGLLAPSIAAGIAVLPVVGEGILKAVAGGGTFGAVSSSGTLKISSIGDEISYIWQLYLPRLPGMPHYFQGLSTWREIWFDRSVGFYGWMDTMFPSWVENVALIVAIPIVLLFLRELVTRRSALKARLPELAAYAAIALALMAMLGVTSYVSDALKHEAAFAEPRYLLPLLPLLGVIVALAIRGGGRRLMPVIGTAILLLFIAHDLFSQIQVIARYYG